MTPEKQLAVRARWLQVLAPADPEESRPRPFTAHRQRRRHSQTVRVLKYGRLQPMARPVPRRGQIHPEHRLNSSERLAVAVLVRKVSLRTGVPVRQLLVCIGCGRHRVMYTEYDRQIAHVDGWLNGRCGECNT